MPFKARSASSPDSILIGLLAAMVLLAWYMLWVWGDSAYGHVLLHGYGHPSTGSQNAVLFAAIFVVSWTLMTIAMMLPTSIRSSSCSIAWCATASPRFGWSRFCCAGTWERGRSVVYFCNWRTGRYKPDLPTSRGSLLRLG